MKKLKSFAAFVILIFSNNALADDDGNDLLRQCLPLENFINGSSPQNTDILSYKQIGFCTGFIQGITNLSKVYELRLGKKGLFCLPELGIENEQALRIVVQYLKEHPEKLHQRKIELVVSAFIEAFPCK